MRACVSFVLCVRANVVRVWCVRVRARSPDHHLVLVEFHAGKAPPPLAPGTLTHRCYVLEDPALQSVMILKASSNRPFGARAGRGGRGRGRGRGGGGGRGEDPRMSFDQF